jgi:hypothetical protein
MIALNLLPDACVIERRTRTRIRIWTAIVPLAAFVLLGSYLWLSSTWTAGIGSAVHDREQVEARLGVVRHELTRQQAEIAEIEAAQRASRAVSDLPDWGLLLQLFPSMGGEHTTLTSCTLMPAKSASDAAKPAVGRVMKYVLTIQGVVDDPKSATDFAVALEHTEIFEKVTLIESTRTEYMGREMLGFRIECVLTDTTLEGKS